MDRLLSIFGSRRRVYKKYKIKSDDPSLVEKAVLYLSKVDEKTYLDETQRRILIKYVRMIAITALEERRDKYVTRGREDYNDDGKDIISTVSNPDSSKEGKIIETLIKKNMLEQIFYIFKREVGLLDERKTEVGKTKKDRKEKKSKSKHKKNKRKDKSEKSKDDYKEEGEQRSFSSFEETSQNRYSDDYGSESNEASSYQKEEKRKRKDEDNNNETENDVIIYMLSIIKCLTDYNYIIEGLPLSDIFVNLTKIIRKVLQKIDFSSPDKVSSIIVTSPLNAVPKENVEEEMALDYTDVTIISSLIIRILLNLFKNFDDLSFESQVHLVPLVLLRLQLHHLLAKLVIEMKSLLSHETIVFSGEALAALFSCDLFLDFREGAFGGIDWDEEKGVGEFLPRYGEEEIIDTFVILFNDVLLSEVEKDSKARSVLISLDEVCGWIRNLRE